MTLLGGVPMQEPISARHEHHKGHVARPELFGRYDPISSSLAFSGTDGMEHTIRVGDNGRLRSVLESGYVGDKEARSIGLPPPEAYKGRAKPAADPGFFNPLTHEYNVDSSPRDAKRNSGRRSAHPHMGTSLTPRLNPLTAKLDPLNTTQAAMRLYDPQRAHPYDYNVVLRDPITAFGFHSADPGCRPHRVIPSPRPAPF